MKRKNRKKMSLPFRRFAVLFLAALTAASLCGCGDRMNYQEPDGEEQEAQMPEEDSAAGTSGTSQETGTASQDTDAGQTVSPPAGFDLSAVPDYHETPSVEIHQNVPFFSDSDMTENFFESYSPLDSLGRCGPAMACLGKETEPTGERGEIGPVKPSGWHTQKYSGIEDHYLYNRCHLIAYMLSGENSNEKNLITGTRYMNKEGMLPYEERTDDYIDITGNHVLYRVTPVFEGDNLLASGVLMEACSVEDRGAGLQFCVYCYNVQPGIEIDYATGDSQGPEYTDSDSTASGASASAQEETVSTLSWGGNGETQQDYVVNINTGKFHYPSCSSVGKMSEHNRKLFHGSREELVRQGYSPCKICHP